MKRILTAVVVAAMMCAVQFAVVSAQSKTKTMTANGTVKSIAGDSLAISVGGKDMTFALDSSTKFVGKGLSTKSGGAPMKAADAVSAGDRVRVAYHDMDGKLHAATVTVTNKAAKP
jgi:hypothetical protein